MVLNAITIVPNGIMRVIGGMEGTNMGSGKEMSGGVKSGLMIGATKAIDAASGARRMRTLDPSGKGTKGANKEAGSGKKGNDKKPDATPF